MRKGAVVVAVSVALLATLRTTHSADADRLSHGRNAGDRSSVGQFFQGRGHSVHGQGHGFQEHRFGHRRFFPRHFGSFSVLAPPLVVFSSPPVLLDPPPYYSAPVYAPPVGYNSPTYTQPPPPPPVPRVVEYPTGRYELRGDGISTAYTWVWIPNPPPPPAAPPPTAPLSSGGPVSGSGDAPPARLKQLYRWVDEEGVVHWTDRSETVPPRYRANGKPLKPS